MSKVREQLEQFWDQRYSACEFVYGTAANTFLVESVGHFPPGAKVLCLADGEGRNGVWLAQQGFAVSSVDVSVQGVNKARRLAAQAGVDLAAQVADLTEYDLGLAQWDVVVSIFLHLPADARADLHRRALRSLKIGGIFLWQAYGPQQLGRGTGGPPDAALLPPLEEVAGDFSDCELVHLWTGLRLVQEGRLHSGQGSVTQLIARKIS